LPLTCDEVFVPKATCGWQAAKRSVTTTSASLTPPLSAAARSC